MSGYFGYSMSNNAVDAYENGEMPLSKWSKANLIEEIKNQIEYEETTDLDIAVVSKMTKQELIDCFLYRSSWHHTSLHYNETNFYSVSISCSTQDVLKIIENRKPKEKSEKPKLVIYYADVRYGEWIGSQKHRKLIEHYGQALICGDWAYLLPFGSRKKINGNHFYILKTYQRKPKEFKTSDVMAIKKRLKG